MAFDLETASNPQNLRRIAIDPISRVEGHGKITLLLDEEDRVHQARLHIVEFRGFEKFVQGRPYWEAPVMVQRLCGICPVSHQIAAAKAMDHIVGAAPPPLSAEKMRRLMHYGQIVQSHALHFFLLSSPDLLFGFDAEIDKRNIVAVAEKYPEVAHQGVALRKWGQEVIRFTSGKRVHGTGAIPGGINRLLTAAARDALLADADRMVAWSKDAVALVKRLADANREEFERFGAFRSGFMSLTRADGALEFYDGALRVRDADGAMICDGVPDQDYDRLITEEVKSWSYMKFPYLNALGREEGMIGQRGEPGAKLEERRNAGDGVERVERADDLGHEAADFGAAWEARPGRVDAVEEAGGGRFAGEELEIFDRGAATADGTEPLALVLGAAARGDFSVGFAEEGIVAADVERDDGGIVGGIDAVGAGAPRGGPRVPEDALGLPGSEAGGDLVGIRVRVARESEGLDREHGGGGVMAMRAAGFQRKTRDEHVGTKSADDAHDVGEDVVAIPEGERFLVAFRETEIVGAGEKLHAAVDAPRGEQFLGADDPERGAEFGADEVLPAVAAGEREVAGAIAVRAGEAGDQARVFVVGVGGDVKHAAHLVEGAQLLQDRAGGKRRGRGWSGLIQGETPGESCERPSQEAAGAEHGGTHSRRVASRASFRRRYSSCAAPPALLARAMDFCAAAIAPALSPDRARMRAC